MVLGSKRPPMLQQDPCLDDDCDGRAENVYEDGISTLYICRQCRGFIADLIVGTCP